MDVERFTVALPECFDEFPSSKHPNGRRFDDIIATVPNYSTENVLALLNLAASLLAPHESYVEVGSYAGASLIGAMRGNEDGDFVAIDRFDWVRRERFDATVSSFGVSGATVLEGDAFEVLDSELLGGRRVGVLFWDADHTHEGQLRGLRAVERHLAPGALVICDNADGAGVLGAVDEWLRERSDARLVLDLGGHTRGQPWWHDGIRAVRWAGLTAVS
jgi:predicted O-methyltransferase YrrM